MNWWLAVWVLTSVGLAILAAGVDYGLVVVGVYVGANALAMAMAWFRRPPVVPAVLRGLGWAAAFQLPIVLFTVLDRDGRFAAVAPSASESPPPSPPPPSRPPSSRPPSALDPPPPAPGGLHGRVVRDEPGHGHGSAGRDH